MKLKTLIMLFLIISQNIAAWPCTAGDFGIAALVIVTFPVSLPTIGCGYGISKICAKYEKYSETKKQTKNLSKKSAGNDKIQA